MADAKRRAALGAGTEPAAEFVTSGGESPTPAAPSLAGVQGAEAILTVQQVAGEAEADLAEQLVKAIASEDASDVDALCQTFRLKRTDLGRLTGFSVRALADWNKGQLPSEPARRRLHELRRLLDALSEIVNVEAIPEWLHARNATFDGMTPLQVIEVGEIDRLWQMVYRLSGDYVD